MKLIIMGPPGVGKGTQAERIKEKLNIIHLSTGNILRDEIKNKSDVGLKAIKFINQGKLVPDDVLLDIVRNRISQADCHYGYLLDGFPRTVTQAEGLNVIMNDIGHRLDAVISLTADENELVRRLVLRGGESGRSDDIPDVIRKRQQVYWKQTAPLIDYYKQDCLLKEVDGLGTIPGITKRIIIALV